MAVRDQLTFGRRVGLPRVLRKVCKHNSHFIETRFRGDMAHDIETYKGRHYDVYTCLQCGKTRDAFDLLKLMQSYILTGQEFIV